MKDLGADTGDGHASWAAAHHPVSSLKRGCVFPALLSPNPLFLEVPLCVYGRHKAGSFTRFFANTWLSRILHYALTGAPLLQGQEMCHGVLVQGHSLGVTPLFSSLPRGPEGPAALPALPSHPLKTLLPGSLLPPCLPFPVTSACPEVTCCPAGLSVLDTPSSSTQ